jgi:hypothetical protein
MARSDMARRLVIAGAEGRQIPKAKLKPKKPQRDSLISLESYDIGSKQ